MPDEKTPESAVANWIEQARAGLDDLRDNDAPCGHEECTERDRRMLDLSQQVAASFITDMEQFEVDPMVAVRVVVDIDARFVDPALDMDPPTIPAWDFHTVLGSIAVALFDLAQLREGAYQEEAAK